jgi:hypothetical protein
MVRVAREPQHTAVVVGDDAVTIILALDDPVSCGTQHRRHAHPLTIYHVV